VAFVQARIPHYREPFFRLLRSRLAESGIELWLVYGQPSSGEASKLDAVDVAWGHRVETRHFSFGGKVLTWQPCLSLLRGMDLVVVEQASRHLLNYWLLVQQAVGGPRLAFWGHGRTVQTEHRSRLGDTVKRYLSKRAHWCFAYTDAGADVFREMGVREQRITVVQNAIDTTPLIRERHRVRCEDSARLRDTLGIVGRNVCIYSGSLYPEKRLAFLVRAAELVRCEVADFELIVVGAGPDRSIAEGAAERLPWLHYVGPVFGVDRVPYFELARLMLVPGLVGLAVIDSFAMEVPLVTTTSPSHAPEIDYLRSGHNGLIVSGESPQAYASEVASLLLDVRRLASLAAGCRASTAIYTMEAMVDRFACGIATALEA
jgi:glycosyltransferase involved in cell wall biosynthesis